MAQSFKAASLSLGEAERQRDGKNWNEDDVEKHQKYYNLKPEYMKLNTVLKSVDGKKEREVVNAFFKNRMLELNQAKIDKVKAFNDEKAGHINEKTGKPYRKKSVDKREVYAVGRYADKGQRKSPYDVMLEQVMKGNMRGKEGDSSRLRTNVLQQFIVGFGNSEEWRNDGDARKILTDAIHDNLHPEKQAEAKKAFEDSIIKPYLERFKKENPSLPIMQAVVHYDETNPHLQFTVLPYVDGKEYGGLGSVSYTGAIQHDHPEFTKDTVISDFYQHEHSEIRELMENARPLKSLDLGVDAENKSDWNFKPGVRPGSHKSLRVDVFSKQKADFERKMLWIAKEDKELSLRRDNLNLDEEDFFGRNELLKGNEYTYKSDCIDVLRQLKPSHQVSPDYVHKGENGPANVSTPLGREQHLRIPALALAKIVSNILMAGYRNLEKLRDEAKKRERDYKLKAEEKARAELEPKIKEEYRVSSENVEQAILLDAFNFGREQGRAELLEEEKNAQQSYIYDYQAIKPDLNESKTDYSTPIKNTRTRVRNAQNAQNEPKPHIKPKKQAHQKQDDGPDL